MTQGVVSVDQTTPLSQLANGIQASGERNIMYHKILLAVDGSDASKRAAEEAFRIAALARARVHALYVVSKWGVAPYAGYYEPEALGTVLREDGRLALEAVRTAMAKQGMPGDIEIDETQNAADNIPSCLERCIQREKIDLVVMGTHGRRGASRIVLGSVAEVYCAFRPALCYLCARLATKLRRAGRVPTIKPGPRKDRSRKVAAARGVATFGRLLPMTNLPFWKASLCQKQLVCMTRSSVDAQFIHHPPHAFRCPRYAACCTLFRQ